MPTVLYSPLRYFFPAQALSEVSVIGKVKSSKFWFPVLKAGLCVLRQIPSRRTAKSWWVPIVRKSGNRRRTLWSRYPCPLPHIHSLYMQPPLSNVSLIKIERPLVVSSIPFPFYFPRAVKIIIIVTGHGKRMTAGMSLSEL